MIKLLTCSILLWAVTACSKDDDSSDSSTVTETSTLSIKGASSMKLLGVDTSAAKMKIYEFHVAKSADCSSPVQLFANDEGKEVDMLQSPDIGSGDLEQGTYECVIMVMSDTITFTPKSTTGVCQAGTEYELDVFQPQGEMYKPNGLLPDGTAVEGAVGEQRMAVYISTLSTSEGGDPNSNPFKAPSSTQKSNGIKLASPLEISEDTVGTLVMDTSGRVESNSGSCDMQPPQFSFFY